ncbi:hypothetical protein ES705_13253 [subsurface metagenome]
MNILFAIMSIAIVICGIKAGINLKDKKEIEGVLWLIAMCLILIYGAVLAK